MTATKTYTFDRVVRIIAVLAIVAVAVWLINTLKNVLLPFCLACLISYMLEPIVEFNKRLLHLPWRIAAIFITLLEVTLIIALTIYFCLPSVIDEVHQMEALITRYTAANHPALHLPAKIQEYFNSLLKSENMQVLLSGTHMEAIISQGSSLVATLIDLLMRTLDWLLTFIYVIFILLDYQNLMRGFSMLVPPKLRPITTRVCTDIKNSMNRYFRSQAVIALCAAVFYSIGFSIVGIPMAIIMGVTVGILYMIPYFQYVTLIPVALLCLINAMGGEVSFWPEFGKCLLVYACSQCICDYVLTPKIMGKAMGLNPAIILLSLSIWGTLLGLIGMIIALPLTTLLLAYYQEFIINRNNESGSASEP